MSLSIIPKLSFETLRMNWNIYTNITMSLSIVPKLSFETLRMNWNIYTNITMSVSIIPKLSFEMLRMNWKFIRISPCFFLSFPNLASRRWEWAGGENGEDQGAAGDHRLAPVQRGQADRAGRDPQGPSPRAGGQDRVLRVGGWTQRAGRALPAAGLPRPAGAGPGARDQAQVRVHVEIEPEYTGIIWELR